MFKDVRGSVGQGEKGAMKMLAFRRELKECRRQTSIKVIPLRKT